jgi:hypothetical protein
MTLQLLPRLARNPRVILAAALLLVAAAVTVANLGGGRETAAPAPPAASTMRQPHPAPSPAVTSAMTAASASVDTGDDTAGEAPDETATITAGPADPAEAALAFAASWLNTLGKTPQQWRASLTGRLTPALAAQLADADPATVPVGRAAGPVQVTSGGDQLVLAAVPVVSTAGAPIDTPTLTPTWASHRWLVSEIDWTAA